MKETFFPNRIIQVLALLLTALLLSTPVFFFIDINSFEDIKLNTTIYFVIFCLIFIGLSYLINYKNKEKIKWDFDIVNIRLLYLLLILLFIFTIGINKPLNNIINYILNNKTELHNPFSNPLSAIGAILFAPILEEIIFRGIILKGLLTRYTPKYAIIFSSIIFGLIHGRPMQMWGALLIGLIFGWIYYKTKSIATTILLHSFVNFISLINGYLLFAYSDSNHLSAINIFLIIISIPSTFIIIRQLILKLNIETIESK
ncbi:CPBP family intramembrane glutamic endopeptidase [Flavobacterium sp. LB3R33]|uniref:CPBP family intramembrane glutamic endopeptidase n=1 Tax=Flavobacterium sp. LB3R33 TaxID=3401721 RepID=UPI003AB0FB14